MKRDDALWWLGEVDEIANEIEDFLKDKERWNGEVQMKLDKIREGAEELIEVVKRIDDPKGRAHRKVLGAVRKGKEADVSKDAS